jgi:hypothetical protein
LDGYAALDLSGRASERMRLYPETLLIHHVLARRGFVQPGMIFTVSAAMLRNRRRYDEILERYSRAFVPWIDNVLDDRRDDLSIRLCLQGKGRLSKAKREQFQELGSSELEQLEALVSEEARLQAGTGD